MTDHDPLPSDASPLATAVPPLGAVPNPWLAAGLSLEEAQWILARRGQGNTTHALQYATEPAGIEWRTGLWWMLVGILAWWWLTDLASLVAQAVLFLGASIGVQGIVLGLMQAMARVVVLGGTVILAVWLFARFAGARPNRSLVRIGLIAATLTIGPMSLFTWLFQMFLPRLVGLSAIGQTYQIQSIAYLATTVITPFILLAGILWLSREIARRNP